jgi:hypothetical protein
MPKKLNILLMLVICIAISLVGCFTPTKNVVIPANFQAVANPMAENLVAGLDKQDYAIFTRDFDEKMIKAIPATALIELRKLLWNQNGNYQSQDMKRFFEEKGYLIAIYNLVFEKGNLDMRLVFTPKPPFKISGLWFPPK